MPKWFVQMGSTMKPTIFDDRVATALKHWHHQAKKHAKDSKHSSTATPFSSRPATPEHGSSPIHLLHNYQHRSLDSLPETPRGTHVETENWAAPAGSHTSSPHRHDGDDDSSSLWNQTAAGVLEPDGQIRHLAPGAVELQRSGTHHTVDINQSDFTFGK